MAGGRQAWCPRCDEVRTARPGAACPVCGRQLLRVPPARPGQPEPGLGDRAARRLRALLPLAGAVGVALLVLAVVGSAFVTGRLTRTTPAAPAAAPTSTAPGFGDDEGPETSRRDVNWQARAGRITVTLRSLTVGTGFSRLELHVDGVPRGRRVSALQRLRIRDADGRDLLARGELASIATATSRPNPAGGVDTEVVLDRPLDLPAVASVELGGLTVGSDAVDVLEGSLLDRELRRKARGTLDDGSWLIERSSCPDCKLRAECQDCHTLRVVGSAYRRGRMLIAVEALGRVEQTALNLSERRVVATGEDGAAELPAWIDGTGGSAVISVGVYILAATRVGDPDDDRPMGFEVRVQAQAEQAIRGGWTMRQAGS
jgi:hypothetical protein